MNDKIQMTKPISSFLSEKGRLHRAYARGGGDVSPSKMKGDINGTEWNSNF
jgi:hypothetical protein